MNTISYSNYPKSSVNFSGRSKYIKDAQWVCHTINSYLPHTSTTRFIPEYKNLIRNSTPISPTIKNPETMQQILTEIQSLIKNYHLYAQDKNLTQEQQNTLRLLEFTEKSITRAGTARKISNEKFEDSEISSILYLLQNFQIGNCYENAKIAEFILLLNGVKNACVAKLKNEFGKPIDHVVCLFNKDGSFFDGNVNNNTIIIDNWAGKTDFAHNMITFYKTQLKEYFDIPINSKLEFFEFSKIRLSTDTLMQLKQKYQAFIHKNNKFMS